MATADTDIPARVRVGPSPAPPPPRLDAMVVLDLLSTVRRWRVHEPFVTGQSDGLARALVACLNAGQPVPRWLRSTIVEYLVESLWEQPRPAGRRNTADQDDARAWGATVATLVARWREPARTHD